MWFFSTWNQGFFCEVSVDWIFLKDIQTLKRLFQGKIPKLIMEEVKRIRTIAINITRVEMSVGFEKFALFREETGRQITTLRDLQLSKPYLRKNNSWAENLLWIHYCHREKLCIEKKYIDPFLFELATVLSRQHPALFFRLHALK